MPDKQEEKDIFKALVSLDVNEHVEQKTTGKATLSYLSWPWAWSEIRKRYPDVKYEILKNDQGLPYFVDPALGIIVFTTFTINGETRMMWLPVMDSANNAMKLEPYEFETKYGPKKVQAATMFDVNKTVMRCLVKNLAMFGLGLYIFAGEDLPEESDDEKSAKREAEIKKAHELTKIIGDIDAEVKRLTKDMKTEEKQDFANRVIVPILGQINYKTYKDVDKLNDLLEKMKAA